MKLLFTLTFLAAAPTPAGADQITNINAVGTHYKLLTFEKSINPENIMVVYSKVDKNCKFLSNPQNRQEPLFDFYWLINGKNYKPVNPMIASGVHKRLEIESVNKNQQEFYVVVNDLSEVKHDLKDNRLRVTATKDAKGQCVVDAEMALGKAKGNAAISVEKIFANAKKTFNPLKPKLLSVEISGESVKTGEELEQVFSAK